MTSSAFFNQRENGEENDRLATGDDYHLFGCRVNPARLTDILRDHLAQLGHPGRRPVVGKTFVQRVAGRLDDVCRSIEIRLADLEMHDIAALRLQGPRFYQHFERGLCAETRHPFGQAKFVGLGHDEGIGVQPVSLARHTALVTLARAEIKESFRLRRDLEHDLASGMMRLDLPVRLGHVHQGKSLRHDWRDLVLLD